MVLQLFAIPIVGVILTLVLSFLGVGMLSILFPQIGTYILVIALGVLAWLTKDLIFYHTKNWSVSGGLFFGSTAAMMVIAMILRVPLPAFGGSIVAYSGATGDFAALGGVEPLSLGSIALVIGATLVAVYFLDIVAFKGKLIKKRK